MDLSAQGMVIADIAIAGLLGGIVGLEREWARKPAGLRTHMIVAGASAFLVDLGRVMVQQFAESGIGETASADPIRIMQAIIVGISFLGAGTIINDRSGSKSVEGLTTAASILLVTGIGMAISLHQYVLGIGVTLMVVLVLTVLGYVENRIRQYREGKQG